MSLTKFERIGLFIRKDSPVTDSVALRVTDFLQNRSLSVFINSPLKVLPDLDVISVDHFVDKCDLVIAIGGDGTLLSASRSLAGTNLPILGINIGQLGFLADLTLDNLEAQLAQILAGAYREDIRFLMKATFNDNNDLARKAMNDVVIHAHQRLHIIEFETFIDGQFLNSQRADGLVVATPTGSTAYAMSAGGPIVNGNLEAVVLASACPHTLSNRPMVIAADSVIDIIVSENNANTTMVSCDGRAGLLLHPGDSIRIERHPDTVKLLYLAEHDHYSILRAKLGWGHKLTC